MLTRDTINIVVFTLAIPQLILPICVSELCNIKINLEMSLEFVSDFGEPNLLHLAQGDLLYLYTKWLKNYLIIYKSPIFL